MKKIFTLSLGIIFSLNGFAQPTFQKTYGVTNSEYGYSVVQITDGGYVVAGSVHNPSTGDFDVYLVRTDAAGNLLWTKTYGGTDEDQGYCLVQTTDGGYAIAGSTQSFGAGVHDMYLLKTDTGGTLLWSKTYGETDYDYAYSLQQTIEGGYVLAGRSKGFTPGYDNIYLVKTDGAGNLLWSKGYGSANTTYWGASVHQTADSGFAVIGHMYDFSAANTEAVLLKVNASGNLLWAKSFGGASNDYGNSVRQTADGGFVIGGSTESFGAGASDVYLIKTDGSGNLSWSKTIGGLSGDYGRFVRQLTGGGYVVAGNIGIGPADVFFFKTNASGTVQWAKSFGGPSWADYGESIQPTADGGYIISGSTLSYGSGNFDVYVIKADSMGNSGCVNNVSGGSANAASVTATLTLSALSGGVAGNAATVTGSGGTSTSPCFTTGIDPGNSDAQSGIVVSLSPNPATNEIKVQSSKFKVESVEIYDVLGKKLCSYQPETSNPKPEINLDVSFLSPGIYFLKLKGVGAERVARFVKQ